MKLTHSLFNYFLIHYFDIMNSVRQDSLHFDLIMNPTPGPPHALLQ